MKIKSYRDLTFIDIDEEKMMVIACDSCGGIGLKEYDVVKTSYEIVGYYTAKLVLCELLAIGAKPILMVDNLCVEMNPAGEGIIKGIYQAFEEINMDGEKLLTGSTEENMLVKQTSMGISCIGIIDKTKWTLPRTILNDDLILVGTPKVGNEVLEEGNISVLPIINEMKCKIGVHEILPVGSKGVKYEVQELCNTSELKFDYINNIKVDITKSAGPATCFLVSGEMEKIEKEIKSFNCDYYFLGKFS